MTIMDCKIAAIWNELVGLDSPTGKDAAGKIGCGAVRVFPNVPDLLWFGSNFCGTFPLGASAGTLTSVFLVLVNDYFSAETCAKTCELAGLRMFGLPLEGSAESFHSKLGTLTGSLSVAAEPERYVLTFRKALAFEFRASTGMALSPDASRITAVEYFYRLQYEGHSRPFME